MSDEKQNRGEGEAAGQQRPGILTAPDNQVSESRRRFTKAGLLVPPVLMSVASRPVWAGGIPCISNMLSGNMSNPQRGQCVTGSMIGGGGPQHWVDVGDTNWSQRTGTAINDKTTLDDIFPANGTWVETSGNKLSKVFDDYLKKPDNINTIQAHFAAAILNAYAAQAASPSQQYVLTPTQLTEHLWNGHYVHVIDVVAFLQSTWGTWEGEWQP